ncbi:MAG: hypothetical protein WCJ45_05450 [bacterium]
MFSNFLAGIFGFLASVALLIVTAFFIGYPMMLLWNWLMPTIFGLPIITFWQALGLYLLAGSLFQSRYTARHTVSTKKKRPLVRAE